MEEDAASDDATDTDATEAARVVLRGGGGGVVGVPGASSAEPGPCGAGGCVEAGALPFPTRLPIVASLRSLGYSLRCERGEAECSGALLTCCLVGVLRRKKFWEFERKKIDCEIEKKDLCIERWT